MLAKSLIEVAQTLIKQQQGGGQGVGLHLGGAPGQGIGTHQKGWGSQLSNGRGSGEGRPFMNGGHGRDWSGKGSGETWRSDNNVGGRRGEKFYNGGHSNQREHVNGDKSNRNFDSGRPAKSIDNKVFAPPIKPKQGPPHYNVEDYINVPTNSLKCQICDKSMWDVESFVKHVRGKKHEDALNKLVAEDLEREDKMRTLISHTEGNNKGKEKCKMCETSVSDLIAHRKSDAHNQLKKFIHPHCSICGYDFENKTEFYYHIYWGYHMEGIAVSNKKFDPMMPRNKTEEMIEKMRKETGFTGDLNKSSKKRKAGTDNNVNDTKKSKTVIDVITIGEGGEDDSSQLIDPSWPGAQFVREVTGFFCDACKKFVSRDVETDLEDHCNSVTHKSKVKAAMLD